MNNLKDQFDQYKILTKIGEGGMGEVYRGVDGNLDRLVAIKLMKPELSSREDIVQRFKTEAKTLGRLNHTNIAAVYNFGKVNEQYYMALEFINGETLDELIKKVGALSCQAAVRYTIAILEGLDHAHEFNIIHRDIKPSNIMVTPQGKLKILDFGIAKILGVEGLTKTGQVVGTYAYASPEQHQGKALDARSDIYSVGAVLYEMLTGHTPFEKDSAYELATAHIKEIPMSPRTFSKAIPVALAEIVLKALEKAPEKRFASALEFSHALLKLDYRLDPQNTTPSGQQLTVREITKRYKGSIMMSRFLGGWIDGFSIALCFLTPENLLQDKNSPDILPIGFMLTIAYFVIGEWLWGRTLGKLMTKTIVVNAKGNRPNLNQVLIRMLFRLLEVNPFFAGPVGITVWGIPAGIAVLCSKHKQRLGDMVANTYVIHTRDLPKIIVNPPSLEKRFLNWFENLPGINVKDAWQYIGMLILIPVLQVGWTAIKGYHTEMPTSQVSNVAAQEDSNILVNNGNVYYKDKKYYDAFLLYQKAAALGNIQGQYNLGMMHEYGFMGVPKDYTQAIVWYKKAANQGQQDAVLALKRLNKTY